MPDGSPPIHPMLVPFPIACFVGTLITDIAYACTHNLLWPAERQGAGCFHRFPRQPDRAHGRPVGLTMDRTGALLVADDLGNAIWRVTAG